MITREVLAFDVGGTKTAWSVVTSRGSLGHSGTFPTPQNREEFITDIVDIIHRHHRISAVGMGIPGVLSEDRRSVAVSPHIPALDGFALAREIEQACGLKVALDNDAQCALIGENWQGAARRYEDVVLLVIGTGVGGAVKQWGEIKPYPSRFEDEIAQIIIDSTDVFPNPHGPGSLEAFLGGKSVERRYGVDLHDMASRVRRRDPEAIEFWRTVSTYFLEAVRVIQLTYGCEVVLVGGIGSHDLEFYLQDEPPCKVMPAKLGEKAGIYGAGEIGLSLVKR